MRKPPNCNQTVFPQLLTLDEPPCYKRQSLSKFIVLHSFGIYNCFFVNDFDQLQLVFFIKTVLSDYFFDKMKSPENELSMYYQATDYRKTVLSAVNLGIDTDTIAAIAGSLAGVLYGAEGIPKRGGRDFEGGNDNRIM